MWNLGLNLVNYLPRAVAGVRSILSNPVMSSGVITGGILGGKATNDTINSGILGDTNLMEEGMSFFSSPAINYLKDIRNTPSGSVLAPDQDAIDKENEFNKELNTKITTASEDNQSNILITPEVEQQSGLLSTPENNPIDFSNTTPLPDQSLLSDYIMTASEAEEPTTTDEGLLSETKNPYYSVLAENVLDMNFTSGTGDQILNQIINMPGVKKSELEDTGLSTFLSGKSKVTKEELDNYILENNVSTQIVDTILGEKGSSKKIKFYNGENFLPDALYGVESLNEAENIVMNDYQLYEDFKDFYEAEGEDRVFLDYNSGQTVLLAKPEVPFEKLEDFEKPLKDFLYYRFGISETEDIEPTMYSQYTIPRGKDNKEILISIPTDGKPFIPAHFKDQVPEGHNLIAHARFNEREIDGQKTLFIEEIQSDLHQAGRRSGYKGIPYNSMHKYLKEKLTDRENELKKEYGENYNSEIFFTDPQVKDLMESIDQNLPEGVDFSVPDAPFKKNWHELAIKRIFKYAVDNGFEAISFTPGSVQQDRYDLTKYIGKVEITKAFPNDPTNNQIKLIAYEPTKNNPVIFKNIDPKELPNYVGKDLGDKIKNDINNKSGDFSKLQYQGLDLKVGGEGMIAFYDNILPSFISKYIKKFDGAMDETSLNTDKDNPRRLGNIRVGEVYQAIGRNGEEYANYEIRIVKDEKTGMFKKYEVVQNKDDIDTVIGDGVGLNQMKAILIEELEGFKVPQIYEKQTTVPIIKITPKMKEEIGKKGINIAKLNSGLLSVA